MADDADESQKTEDPTEKRLEKARSEGQVAKSREFNSFGMLLLSIIIFVVIGPWTAANMSSVLTVYLRDMGTIPFNLDTLKILFTDLLIDIAIYTGPMVVPFFVMFILANILQHGFVWAPKVITKLDITKLSPLKGLQRYFQAQHFVEFIKGLLKIAMVSVVGYLILVPQANDILNLLYYPVTALFAELSILTIQILVVVVLIMGVMSIADILFQRYSHTKKLKMTKHQIKEERKDMDGNPEIKRRLMQIRMERYRMMLGKVIPESDVVITNPTHYAVALKYNPLFDAAPTVTAKGQDHLALLIRKLANDNDVVVYESPPLARALYASVEVGEEIKEEQYQAVAEIIRYVNSVRAKARAA